MIEREKFEAWLIERKGYSLDRSHTGVYMTLSTHELWMSWQASRAAALEDAVKECEQMQKHFDTQDAIDAAEQCAMAIRELKGK